MKIQREWQTATKIAPNTYLMGISREEIDVPPDNLDEQTIITTQGQEFPSHRHVEMTYLDGSVINIDVGLAKLMRHLWDNQIRTEYCCQGDAHPLWEDTRAYIMFERSEDAAAFVKLAVEAAGDHSFLAYAINADDSGIEIWHWKPAYYEGRVRWTARFPRHHIKELEESFGLET